MTAPFALPVEWAGPERDVLIAANHELICETEAASDEERDYIARAVNKHDLLLELLEAAQMYVPLSNVLHLRIAAALE